MHAKAQDAAAASDLPRESNGGSTGPDGAPQWDLYAPEVYFNRELSWLDFNQRVLNEALDRSQPLLERLKFICITSSNMDEFFMVRVAGLKQQLELGVTDLPSDGMTVEDMLTEIHSEVCSMNRAISNCFQNDILPGLEQNGVMLHRYDELTEEAKIWCETYFKEAVFPVLSPLAIDPGHPFPHLLNLSLNLLISIQDKITDEERIAIVQVPPVVPRLVRIPVYGGGSHYVLLGEVIAANAQALFPGLEVNQWFRFRVTRNADLEIADDEAADLLKSIEEQIRRRRWGAVVRVEVDSHMPDNMLTMLRSAMHLQEREIYPVDGPVNLADFMELTRLGMKQLKDTPFTPRIVTPLRGEESIFSQIRKRDIFLHHPYDSFSSIVEFIEMAADDPKVLAIKLTLYRTNGDSNIIRALAHAAENGKQVTAFVELKARFDEENNIVWARSLEHAGVHVVYGIIGLKTHSKLALVVRRERTKLRSYVHLSTGNYNEITSRIYTDFALLTCREDIAFEATEVFNYLTGYSHQTEWKKIILAPVSMRQKVLELIQREAEMHSADKPGRIIAKINALVDAQVIRALYRASRTGVRIDLIVRGICCLKPGVPGLSDNIRVRSIIGRFLEHSRVFVFENGGDPEVFFSSADWMPRNLNRRVEALFAVDDPYIKKRIVTDILPVMLADNVKAYQLQPDGTYVRPAPKKTDPLVNSQEAFISYAEDAYKDKTEVDE